MSVLDCCFSSIVICQCVGNILGSKIYEYSTQANLEIVHIGNIIVDVGVLRRQCLVRLFRHDCISTSRGSEQTSERRWITGPASKRIRFHEEIDRYPLDTQLTWWAGEYHRTASSGYRIDFFHALLLARPGTFHLDDVKDMKRISGSSSQFGH